MEELRRDAAATVSVFEYFGLHRIKGLLSDGILPDVEKKFTRLDQRRWLVKRPGNRLINALVGNDTDFVAVADSFGFFVVVDSDNNGLNANGFVRWFPNQLRVEVEHDLIRLTFTVKVNRRLGKADTIGQVFRDNTQFGERLCVLFIARFERVIVWCIWKLTFFRGVEAHQLFDDRLAFDFPSVSQRRPTFVVFRVDIGIVFDQEFRDFGMRTICGLHQRGPFS